MREDTAPDGRTDNRITFSGLDADSKARHDPGGKVRIRLRQNITGGARFSDCGRYRPLLWRDWAGAERSGYVLWVGMNPSTADGDADDPTVRRECDFTMSWGYGAYRKCNVMDLRATHPRDLLGDHAARSDANLPTILEQARSAEVVVLAFGALHKRLEHHGRETVEALADLRNDIKCLGFTANGSPRHPLYLRKDSQLLDFAA